MFMYPGFRIEPPVVAVLPVTPSGEEKGALRGIGECRNRARARIHKARLSSIRPRLRDLSCYRRPTALSWFEV